MKLFSSPLILLLGMSVIGLQLSGCSPSIQENAMLDQARSAFAEAQSDPDVQKNAPLELQKAKVNLDKAEKLLTAGAEAPEVEHFAYLAKQRTAIAQETTNVKLAEQAVDAASAERSQILLKARTLEADRAIRMAEKAKAEALAAEEQARTLQEQIAELQATKSERGLVVTLGDVLFDTNKSELRSGALYTIDKLAAFLAEYPTRNVLIEGFTDSTGTVEYNLSLSERRAEAVRNALVARGISSSRLMTRGYGVDFPVASNETAEGRQRNRRVEVIISDEAGRILERKN